MNRSATLNTIWLAAATVFGAWASNANSASMLVGGTSGLLMSVYFLYVAIPSMGNNLQYLLRIIPLFVAIIATFLLSPSVIPTWANDAIVNGFRGFAVGLFLSAFASQIIPKAKG